jgi:aminoglycoside phosphotransferase (APT) family kinase protein
MISSGASEFLAARLSRRPDLPADYTILSERALRYQHVAMGHAHFDALADQQRDAARAALRHVLGTVPVDAVVPMAGGFTTAAVFRIEAGGRRYVLRVEGTPSPLRNPHQYQSMRIAAEAGIAPRLYYADEDSRVAVIDYIETRPLGSFAGGPYARAQALGELRRRLDATPVFPAFVDYPSIVARLWAHVCRTGLFADGVLDPVNERLAEIRTAYVWDRADSVSCHNDPVPANILYDGNRLWLVDWESAYRNDPLVDVAIMCDHLARAPDLENILLPAWLGGAPDEALRTRLEQVAALTRLYYAGVFLSASALVPRAAPDTGLAAPTMPALEQAVAAGRLKSGTRAHNHVVGKMFIASFLTGRPTPRF